MKSLAIVAAIAMNLAVGYPAVAQQPGDETADYTVETVLTGLDNPWGLAVRPGQAKAGVAALYIAESGTRRVVRISTDRSRDVSEVIIGFPENSNSQNRLSATGPLGLLFLNRSQLVVGSGGLGRGKDRLRVYRLPTDGSVLTAKQMYHSVGPISTDNSSAGVEGSCYGLAKTNDDLLFATFLDDDSQSWILKAPVKANRLVDLQSFIAMKKLAGNSGPMGITVNPQPRLQYLVVGLMGSVETPRDSRLRFFSPKSGTLALDLATGLHDIVGLAYSPNGTLYAVDLAWNAEQDGGVYRLDDAQAGGRQVCRPVKIASADKPTALVFVGKGTLYVTALGDRHSTADGEKKSGVLLKITGDL